MVDVPAGHYELTRCYRDSIDIMTYSNHYTLDKAFPAQALQMNQLAVKIINIIGSD